MGRHMREHGGHKDGISWNIGGTREHFTIHTSKQMEFFHSLIFLDLVYEWLEEESHPYPPPPPFAKMIIR